MNDRGSVWVPAGAAFRIAFDSLWAYKLRTFLTALGVMIGVSTVIAIDGIIGGLNTAFGEQVASLGTGTLYVSRRPWIVIGDWWRYVGRPPIDASDAAALSERISLAKAVVPFIHHRATLDLGSAEIPGVRVIGSTEDWPQMSGFEPAQGRFLTVGDLEAARPVVAVGSDTARVLQREGVGIGDRVRIAGRPFTVVGEMPSRGSIFGRSQDDFVVMPLSLFQRMFGDRWGLQVGVVVEPEQLDDGEDEIVGVLRVARGIEPGAETNFSINTQQMFVTFYEQLTRALFATAVGLGFITLIVGGVGIMNIMLVAVAERTSEIGIRKALGARPLWIMTQFVIEAGMVSGVGGILGTTLGMLLTRLVASWTPLPAQVSSLAIVFGVTFGFMVGVVFGFLPAYRASRLLPVDALRAE